MSNCGKQSPGSETLKNDVIFRNLLYPTFGENIFKNSHETLQYIEVFVKRKINFSLEYMFTFLKKSIFDTADCS